MMTSDEFETWVAQHCEATAAGSEAAKALLANHAVFIATWGASRKELEECTARLVAKFKVPKWANEHSDAVGNELHHLRLESASEQRSDAAAQYPLGGPPARPKCRKCGDTGLVTVPHPPCVRDRRISMGPRTAYRFCTGAVLCDAPGCAPGLRVRDAESRRDVPASAKRMTLSAYESRFQINGPGLLEQYEREQAARARAALAVDPKVEDPMRAVLESLLGKARSQEAA